MNSEYRAQTDPTRDSRPRSSGATAVALTVTIGGAAAAWLLVIRQMSGMDMGTDTPAGSFSIFVLDWTLMMAAMMLPGALPTVVHRARDFAHVAGSLGFVASYLSVWAGVGVLLYVVYRPHTTAIAGVVVVAAGIYELTPFKQRFRRRCREELRSGFKFGLVCVGSSVGLMAVMAALGLMNVGWMVGIAAVIAAQKVLRPIPVLDLLLGAVIVGLGAAILVAPSMVPGLASAL